ncbi:putative membrane protein YczE [Microterricola gilva]|uniref:Putative membrane protein YczE n=1 Tax=Microterricola gilva TaxID=393267 RepID=A0A4Q8AJ76_9MICO|nr:hypothetical protein [Microterricola gilva]RZU63913.1 putative membrane protein YczE [Microterricola gilva]
MTGRLPRRFAQLFLGLFLYGIGIALIVRGEIGAAPWDVLTQGIGIHTGLSFGLITVLTSAMVLLIWIPLRQKPGIGTVLNALLVGPSADVGLALIPAGLDLWVRILLFIAGLLVLAVATGLYIGAHFGPGPRDGLMTGLNARTGWAIWKVRTGIELTVVTLGWILGGNVGIGTAAFALLVGPLCQWAIPFFAVKPRATDAAATPSDPAASEPEQLDAEQFDAERLEAAQLEAELETELEGTATPSSPQLDSPAN